jgi:hypothetical protein
MAGEDVEVRCEVRFGQIVTGGARVGRGALDGRNVRTEDDEWRWA